MKFPYKTIIIVLLCVCLVLGIYGICEKIFGGVKKQIATMGTIEDLIATEGYIVRDETVIADNSGTVIDSLLADGERAAKGQQVATVYDSSVDAETLSKLKSLNERIDNLEKSATQNKILGSDTIKSDALVKSKTRDIIMNAHRGQATQLSEIKTEIEMVIDQKKSGGESNNVLEELKSEKTKLENSITGEKTELNAPESGMYFPFIDGGEEVFIPDKIEGMTVDDFENIDPEAYDEKKYTGAKIVEEFEWYYVTVMETKKALALKKGQEVKLRFNENSTKTMPAQVISISKDDGGQTVTAFKVYSYNEYAYANRHVKADVIVSSATGLKFLKDAIRVEDSVTGVYVIDDSVAKFRQVEILGSDDKYVVVKSNISDYKSVALYDEIVVKGDVENNKIIK